METYKIDIFLKQNFIVAQDLETQEQRYTTISELSDSLLTAYDNFKNLVDNKTTIEYTQIYISKDPIARFVSLNVDYTIIEGSQEFEYVTLTDLEKNIFDTFYNTFTE